MVIIIVKKSTSDISIILFFIEFINKPPEHPGNLDKHEIPTKSIIIICV